MPLTLTATPEQAIDPTIQPLIQQYLALGGKPEFISTMQVKYPFHVESEKLFSLDNMDACLAAGIRIDNMPICIKKPSAFLDEVVPEDFPEAVCSGYNKVFPDTETETQRFWKDYAPFYRTDNDGNVVIKCAHVPCGSTHGFGLPHDELLVWVKYFRKDMIII